MGLNKEISEYLAAGIVTTVRNTAHPNKEVDHEEDVEGEVWRAAHIATHIIACYKQCLGISGG